jgi:hypothetical protein
MKKFFWFIFTIPCALLPFEISILFWFILKPVTFWQKLISVVLAIIFLSTVQFVLLLGWIAFLHEVFCIVDEENKRKKRIKMYKENRIKELL